MLRQYSRHCVLSSSGRESPLHFDFLSEQGNENNTFSKLGMELIAGEKKYIHPSKTNKYKSKNINIKIITLAVFCLYSNVLSD